MNSSSDIVKKPYRQTGKNKVNPSYDIIIGGGGYVGLSVAVSIVHQAPHLKVVVIEAAPSEAVYKQERAFAVVSAATKMLSTLGVWDEIAQDAEPILEMVVTDSKLQDVTRPVFLTFENSSSDEAPFAHMVPNSSIVSALRNKAEALGIVQIFGSTITGYSKHQNNHDQIEVCLDSGKKLSSKLLIAADGVKSKIRDMAGIKTVHWPYNQSGIVTTVVHERPHNGRAEEHFLPAGPFATLPLKGNRCSLVWTESDQEAKRLLELDDISFELELEQRFSHRLGELSIEGGRKAFPLGLTLAREFIAERVALVGDAAHGIHPISGQGLNLGFKDAAALAQTIIEADRLGLDIGSIGNLERYQQWRRFDTVQMGVVTDVLNRLFSNDNDLLRITRDVGLGLVDRMPGLKQMFINQASGDASNIPNLLKGEAI